MNYNKKLIKNQLEKLLYKLVVYPHRDKINSIYVDVFLREDIDGENNEITIMIKLNKKYFSPYEINTHKLKDVLGIDDNNYILDYFKSLVNYVVPHSFKLYVFYSVEE